MFRFGVLKTQSGKNKITSLYNFYPTRYFFGTRTLAPPDSVIPVSPLCNIISPRYSSYNPVLCIFVVYHIYLYVCGSLKSDIGLSILTYGRRWRRMDARIECIAEDTCGDVTGHATSRGFSYTARGVVVQTWSWSEDCGGSSWGRGLRLWLYQGSYRGIKIRIRANS